MTSLQDQMLNETCSETPTKMLLVDRTEFHIHIRCHRVKGAAAAASWLRHQVAARIFQQIKLASCRFHLIVERFGAVNIRLLVGPEGCNTVLQCHKSDGQHVHSHSQRAEAIAQFLHVTSMPVDTHV